MRFKILTVSLIIFSPLLFAEETSSPEEMGALDPKIEISTSSAYVLADEYFKNRDYDSAIKEYLEILKATDHAPVIHRKLTLCYMFLGLYRKAIEHGELYLETNPDDRKRILRLLVHLNLRTANFAKVDKYIRGIKSLSSNIEARDYMELGMYYSETGRLHDAIDAFSAVLSAPGTLKRWRVLARSSLAGLYMNGGNYAQAKEEARLAIKISELKAVPYTRMASIYHSENNMAEAISWIELALKESGVDPSAMLLASQIYGENKDSIRANEILIEAKSNIERAIKNNKREDGVYYVMMADVLRREKDYLKALDYADKAVGFRPASSSYVMRGMCNFQLGNIKNALRDLNKAKQINPMELESYRLLANVHRRAGRFAAAQKEAAAALKINPYNRFILAEAEKIKNRQQED